MQKFENKKKEIDLMNVFLCLIVVFIHVASEAVSSLHKDSWQFFSVFVPHKLSSFAVYGFIFISAVKLFLKDVNKINTIDFYKKRIKKIIIPYIISVLIYYIYFIYIGYFKFSIKDLIGYIFKGDLVAHFYFIIIIAQFYLLFPILKKIVNRLKPFWGILTSFIITLCFTKYLPIWLNMSFKIDFIYNDRIFTTYLFYWILGAYVGMNYGYFNKIICEKKKIIYYIFIAISIIFLAINYNFIRFNVLLDYLNIVQLIYSLLAIISLYTLCISLSKKEKIYSLSIPINISSYTIYLYHILPILIIQNKLNDLLILNIGIRLFIKLFVVYFIIITYSCFKKYLLEKRKGVKI